MPEFRDVIPGSQVSVSQPSLAGLQAALAAGTLSSAALTGFYLQRIERLNPALHAVITVNTEAPDEAAASDAARAVDGPRGPLEGIPVLVKDNVQVAGMPTTAGSPALLSTEPGDAFLVERLRAAGAVIIGKANLSEWANFRSSHSTSGWSTLGGQTARTRSRPLRTNWPNGPGFTLPVPLTRTPSTPPPSRGPAWASGGMARRRPGRPPLRCSTRWWPGCARSVPC